MKNGTLSYWMGRKRIRVDSRASAFLTYRAALDRGMGRRMAYMCAVARYGYDRASRHAWGACQGWDVSRAFLSRP